MARRNCGTGCGGTRATTYCRIAGRRRARGSCPFVGSARCVETGLISYRPVRIAAAEGLPQLFHDSADDRPPISSRLLAEQPDARIPWRIGTAEHPAPIRHGRQQDPDRHIESAGHVNRGVINGYDEIHRRRLRRKIVEVLEGIYHVVVEDFDPEITPSGRQIGSTVAVLEIDESETALCQNRRPGG